ncbi:MAG: hypothetical protein LLG08_04035 [Actinomycetia bacterium]|nr:hypothetical protein [Actinomycetes bacterium]
MNKVHRLSNVEGAPKVFVAQPNMGLISPCHVPNLFGEAAKYSLYYFAPERVSPHDRARNLCHKAFLDSDADYMLWLDDDSYLDTPILKQFIEADRDMISAVFQTIKHSSDLGHNLLLPTCMNESEEAYRPVYGIGLTEVQMAPLACALIKREVMEKVERPAFSWGKFFDGWGIEGYGEDVYFCRKVREAGFRIWSDFRTLGHHWLRMDTWVLNNILRDVAEKGEVV